MIEEQIKKANIEAMKNKDTIARAFYSVLMNKIMLEKINKREKGQEMQKGEHRDHHGGGSRKVGADGQGPGKPQGPASASGRGIRQLPQAHDQGKGADLLRRQDRHDQGVPGRLR